jgi:hypothetical protein
MTDFVADVTTWVVLTSTPETQLVEVDVGQQFTSRQTCVLFTDEEQAIVYAIEHGWTPEPLTETYSADELEITI